MRVCAPRVWLAVVLTLPLLLACRATSPLEPEATTPSTVLSSPTPAVTISPAPPRPAPPTAVLTSSSTLTLTVWTTQELGPGPSRAGPVVQSQLDAFGRAHPNVRVEVILKKPSGKGGLLDFLLNAQAVVPALLPDLIALDSRELAAAAQTGLLQPLDADLPAGIFADLLPPAQKIARWRGQWIALPVSVDAEHLVYNTDRVKRPPRTWDETLSSGAALLLPADGDDAFLFQYLAAGGTVQDASGAPALSADITAQVLTFFRRGRESGVIPDSALALKSVEEVWPLFLSGAAGMAQVSASQYLAEADKAPHTGFAPLPTREGLPTTLTRAWVYALLAKNPLRKAAALDLLSWLASSDRLADWAAAAHRIPARRTSLAAAMEPGDYTAFLRDILDRGNALPSDASPGRQLQAWHTAVVSVLRGQAAPVEAANQAANSIK